MDPLTSVCMMQKCMLRVDTLTHVLKNLQKCMNKELTVSIQV